MQTTILTTESSDCVAARVLKNDMCVYIITNNGLFSWVPCSLRFTRLNAHYTDVMNEEQFNN